MPLKLGEALEVATSNPENLIFCASATLRKIVEGDFCLDDGKVACATELIARHFLSGRADETLDKIFKDGELSELRKLGDRNFFCSLSAKDIPEKLWRAKSEFSGACEIDFRRKLIELLDEVDGFIPVYQELSKESEAFFIPFHFEDGAKCGDVRDLNGDKIPCWTSHYQNLFGSNFKFTCVIHCKKLAGKLSGSSLMLPIFLAYKRKVGDLPKYDHLRLIASGEIRGKRLAEVQVAEKYRAFKQLFKDAYFLFPETKNFCADGPSAVQLSTSADMSEILEFIGREIEAKGLVIPTFKDAIKRVRDIEIEIRRDNYNNWKQILDRIGNIEIAIPEDRSPKSRLLCLMLKSASYCHMGRAKEALKFNSKARQFAAERGFSSEFRRLEIEELVELQDEERFEEILDLSKTIAADDFDLQMRYHGTMGQAHSYGYLSGIDGFSKEMAKWHFEEALKYAYMLDSEPDISQDLNYMYLWYALFDPASRESEEAYAKARNHIKCNLQDLEKSRKRNVFFLKRIRLMSYYRRMLGADKVSDLDYQKEKLPDEADNWLRALACKYLGAIAAANGIMDLSERLFEEGIELMPLPDSPGILSCIRMSILMEYYKSLGKTKHLETAKRELSSLLNTFPIIASKWLKFLKGSSDYPALSYWY